MKVSEFCVYIEKDERDFVLSQIVVPADEQFDFRKLGTRLHVSAYQAGILRGLVEGFGKNTSRVFAKCFEEADGWLRVVRFMTAEEGAEAKTFQANTPLDLRPASLKFDFRFLDLDYTTAVRISLGLASAVRADEEEAWLR